MTDEDDNSFLLVGMEGEEEDKRKTQISTINRDSSTISNITNKIEDIKENKKDKKKCFERFINRLLSLDKKNKNKITKKNDKFTDEDFFIFEFFPEKIVTSSRNPSNPSINESSMINFDTSMFNQKKKSIIKNVIDLKKGNEWNEFIKEYRKDQKENNKIKILLKEAFNINSDFILIWKFIYSLFYMIIFFFAFFHFIFFELINLESDELPSKRILYLYYIMHFMFLADLILSLLILIINGGSKFSYMKIPIKIYLVIPFPLKKKYILFLLPKFCRVDLFRRIFRKIEQFIVEYITPFIQDYHLKIFILYLNRLFSYLLEFGLYAHFACCLYCYLDNIKYNHGIYYTVEIITTMGYGEQSPKNVISMWLVMITIFIGSNFVILTNCNISFITTKIRNFSRTTSPRKKLESFIIHIQSSTDKIFPKSIKDSIDSFIKFYQGLSYDNIQSEYLPIYSLFTPKTEENILNSTLNFLRLEYKFYFFGCENDFINSLFAKLKPRIYKEDKTIINIGQKVEKLYFLLNGILLAYDANNNNVFNINNSSIFCEYEFITGFKSEFTIKTHPDIISYGFVIKKKDWDIITKKYIFSSKKFISLCLQRRKNFVKKIKEIYEDDITFKKDNKGKNKITGDKNIFNRINKYQKKVLSFEKNFIQFKEKLFEHLKCK